MLTTELSGKKSLELRNASDTELQKSLPYKGQENIALEVAGELDG